MIKWLKYYFLGFFNDKFGKEAANRSIGNILLSLIFYFVIITVCITTGFNESFPTHYNKATQFKEFTHELFLNEDASKRVIVSIDENRSGEENKYLLATLNGQSESVVINSFEVSEDAKYEKNGYKVIIDTRNSTTSYVDFDIVFYKKDSTTPVKYEDYQQLENKDNYTGKLVFVDKEDADTTNDYMKVLTDDEIKTYVNTKNPNSNLNAIEWLDSKTVDADDTSVLKHEWNEVKKLDTTSNEYFRKTYDLYVRNYYSLSTTPTVVTYYQNTYAVTDAETGKYVYSNYLILTDSWCVASFTNDAGVNMTFDGFYDTLANNFKLNDPATSNEENQANIDTFFDSIYTSVSSIKVLYTIVSLFRFLPFLLISLLVIGLLIFALCKLRKRRYGEKLFGGFKIASSYLLYSSIITGLISLLLCFVVSNDFAYAFSCWGLVGIIAIRTIIFVIMQEIRISKNPEIEPVNEVVSPTNTPIGNNLNLSNVDMGTKVIVNENASDDDEEDETMELM